MAGLFGGSSYNLNDKVVIITGASSGIGRALAEACAKEGSHVVLAARREADLQETLKLLTSGSNHLLVVTDVSKPEDCKLLIDKTMEHYGRMDVLVNCAGIGQVRRFDEHETLDYYHKLMEVNYYGVVHCTHHALPHLKKSDSAMIVTISSMTGKLGVPTKTGYCASKHAVHGFMDALRMELQVSKDDNVHILLACPGYVSTNIRKVATGTNEDEINSGNIMTPEECTAAIVRAIKAKKREVLVVDTPFTKLGPLVRIVWPQLADKLIIKKQKGGRT